MNLGATAGWRIPHVAAAPPPPPLLDVRIMIHNELTFTDVKGHATSYVTNAGQSPAIVPGLTDHAFEVLPFGTTGFNSIGVGIVSASADFAIAGAFTVELSHFIGNTRSFSGFWHLFGTAQTAPGAGAWAIREHNGDLEFAVGVGGVSEVIATVPVGSWPSSGRVDIAGVRRADGYLELYVGGVLMVTSGGPALVTLSGAINIGVGGWGYSASPFPNDYPDGLYDELRLCATAVRSGNYTPSFPLSDT